MTDAGRYAGLLADLGARPTGRGWRLRCPCPDGHRNGDRNWSAYAWVGTRGELVCRCYGCGAKWPEILGATRTRAADWWPGNDYQRRRVVSKVTAIYDYLDECGTLYAQKLRKEPGDNGAKKKFTWRRPLPLEVRDRFGIGPGEPAWAYKLDAGFYQPGRSGNPRDLFPCDGTPGPDAVELPKVVPGLYRLPSLLGAAFEDVVLMCEGEGKVNRLVSLGFNAVCGPHGASAWDYRWAEHFRDRKVVVFPDNDVRGIGHATAVAGCLVAFGAAGVKYVSPGEHWPIPEDTDVGDWLDAIERPKQRKAVLELLGKFPSYRMTAVNPQPRAA